MRIDFESVGFPPGGPVTNGYGVLTTSWDELLWAAVTVGRPNRHYVFQHGLASMYEAIFRWSLVRMALEQSGPAGYRLRRTAAAKSLDPSEKGAINYFLGMAVCKLFAANLLNAPWLLHLDVFRPALNPVLSGRSRPDLIGQTMTGDWLAFESKGRVSPPGATAKLKAKQQAQRCLSVCNTPVTYQIGGIAYFRNDVLQFWWEDPRPSEGGTPNGFEVTVNDNAWEHYYRPALEVVRSNLDQSELASSHDSDVSVEHLDMKIRIFPEVLKLLVKGAWAEAKNWCDSNTDDLLASDYQPDGIRVTAGQSWHAPFESLNELGGV